MHCKRRLPSFGMQNYFYLKTYVHPCIDVYRTHVPDFQHILDHICTHTYILESIRGALIYVVAFMLSMPNRQFINLPWEGAEVCVEVN